MSLVPRLPRYTVDVDAGRALLVSICLLFLPVTVFAAARPLLVCYGDSITAGLGLPYGQSYPAYLQRMLDAQGYHYTVKNLGASGATTKDALDNIQAVLRLHPAAVVVEFGGNDGLRGLPLAQTRRNLSQVLTALKKANIRILLAGITLPPNYGPEYIHAFDKIFPALAAEYDAALVPMLYAKLIHVPGTIQADGIHPTAKGSKIIAETLLPALKPLLKKQLPASSH